MIAEKPASTKPQLRYRNSWESDIYTVGNRSVKDLKKVEIDGELHDVHSRVVTVDYFDMGHNHTAVSKHYFVTTRLFGTDLEIDLNRIVPSTAVFAVEYTAD